MADLYFLEIMYYFEKPAHSINLKILDHLCGRRVRVTMMVTVVQRELRSPNKQHGSFMGRLACAFLAEVHFSGISCEVISVGRGRKE